jgi:CRP-like cAMP-binding protein
MIQIMLKEPRHYFDALKSERRSYVAGEIVFRRDEPVEWLHFVDRGLVNLVRYQESGNVTVLQRAEPGYFLAEASIFSECYHCDGCAVTPTDLTRYPRKTVVDALRSDPEFAAAWTLYLSREVQRARARAEILSLRKLSDRLEAWLSAHGGVMPPKGSWRNLAREIGVSPEALYRHLSTLPDHRR